jgi:hypothetical protein
MDDPGLVGAGEPLGDAGADPDGLPHGQGPVVKHRPQGLSFNVFHRDEDHAVGLVDLVDGGRRPRCAPRG